MRTTNTLLALLLATLSLALTARAQSTPASPPNQTASLAPASRILHNFDFEETALGNFESIPMYWSKVLGRGFPAYASGRFDHSVFRSHNSSFRLDIDSGSAAYRFVAPAGQQITVGSTGDYYILGFVKTANLHHARAQISAWFADDQGNLLPDTEAHSEPYASPTPANSDPDSTTTPTDNEGGWHVIHLFIPGPRAGTPLAAQAKTLVLQVNLLQPQMLTSLSTDSPNAPANPLGRFQLYDQDIKGTAWFDDIAVFQLPRVAVEVPSTIPANLFQSSQPIDLDLTVSDFSTPTVAANAAPSPEGHVNVSLKLTDTEGLLFAHEDWTVPTTAETSDAPHTPWLHHFTHAPLPPGTYTATLDVADGQTGSLIARRQTQFASLAPLPMFKNDPSDLPVAPEFGITAYDWPTSAWTDLPAALAHLGVGWVQIPAWRKEMSEDALRRRDPPFDALLSTLDRANIHAIFGFSQLPTLLAQKITQAHNLATTTAPTTAPAMTNDQLPMTNSSDPLLSLIDADPSLWRPYASFLVARYSNAYNRWEVGSQDAPFSGTLSSTPAPTTPLKPDTSLYSALYQKLHDELASLLAQPRLLIPWNALFDFDPKAYPNAVLDLRIPSVIKPSQIPMYIRDFKLAAGNDLFIHIDPLDQAPYSHADRLSDFAQRILYARAANPTCTLVDLPLTRRPTLSSTGTHSEPLDLFVVYRTLVRTLGNASFRREIPLGAATHAFLFSRQTSGSLAIWNDSPDDTTLDIPLGDNPRAVSLNGSSKPLPVDPATRLTHLTLSNTPLIIDHIDAKLVELRSTFAFANDRFPAGAGVVHTEVLLENPYDELLNATLTITPPKGWTIDPPTIPVAIPPHAKFHQPVTIRYPFTESVGEKSITARFASDGIGPGSGGQPLHMAFPISVNSDLVEVDGFARTLPNGDLVTQLMITNISNSPLNAEAYALAPGYARQSRFVLNLPPGQTTVKRFTFPLNTNINFKNSPSPEDLSTSLTHKTITTGLRQSDGKTLITKTLTIN